MLHAAWIATAGFIVDLLLRVGLAVRVIMRRLPVGVALAWLAVILIFPFVGSLLYLFVGEYRLGHRRTRRALAVDAAARELQAARGFQAVPSSQDSAPPVVMTAAHPAHTPLVQLGASLLEAPLLAGNQLELLENADAAFPTLIADIDRAERSCELEFYIWSPGGRADEVGAALRRAAERGVTCRVLVDALGSAAFLRSPLAADLRRCGVQLHAALGTGLVSAFFVRPDLRMHRKIAVIDRRIAYTGSLNLADPRLFKQSAGVGQWVDALARIRGPAVAALTAIVLKDWAVETKADLISLSKEGPPLDLNPQGPADLQVFSSGPFARVDAIEQLVLMALYLARRELVLTTPYFIPSESLLLALLSAARRGVAVTLIVPAKIDSRLVHFGSRAFQADLLAAGARVALFQGGLLHTKSMTVDGEFSLFGSLNLDPRSMRLDFEVTLAVYNAGFTTALRGLQQFYLDQSDLLDPAVCGARSALERFAENTARLAGPVL